MAACLLLQGMNAAIDYGAGRMRAVCESSPIECHFADVRGLTVPVGGDGIHPTPEVRGLRVV